MDIMPNSKILENIVKAAMKGNTVIITYTDNKGAVTSRETEPYEVKNGSYWGYCLERNSIRQFSLGKVSAATVTNKKYVPRWPVKISSSET